MHYDFAPMEGATDAIFRNAHYRFFGGIDRYWMPFWSPTKDHVLTQRVRRDILPEQNQRTPVVPQILTKSADDFLWAAGELVSMGYREVNLNLGCPSGTVAAKGKGAGFLADLARLEQFLDTIFVRAPLAISIKTRLGIQEPEEFEPILSLYNRYPLKELVVHARVLQDQYKRPARPETAGRIYQQCRCPVIYNGDLKTVSDCADFAARFPNAETVMIGRGLLADPALASKCKGGAAASRETLQMFHNTLWEGYRRAFGSDRNAMLRMKEHWRYLILLFHGRETYAKRLRKAADPRTFEALVQEVLQELPFLPEPAVDW